MAELAEQFELHPNQIIQFRQHAVENMAGLFAKEGAAKPSGPSEADLKVLHVRRGAQQGGIAERQAMINRQHPLSVVTQCKLLGLSRARVYRLPTPPFG